MSITTIIGPMFSGKTTELLRLIDRKRIAGKKCVIIKHIDDTRYVVKDVKNIVTHSEIKYAKCDIFNLLKLDEIDFSEYEVIGIDEGFFFQDLTRFCNVMANNGHEMIIATLDSDYKQEIFPEIGSLIACSEVVVKLHGVCMICKTNDASFTIRIVDSDKHILVGGQDKYKCVCRKCMKEE